MVGWISPGIWKDQDTCPGCLFRAQVRFKRGVDVSSGKHARDASATLGSLGPREMPGTGVNPVRHVPQSVPTRNASGGPWDPLPAPREAGMGRKTSDSRREMGDARDHTAGRVTKVQGASDHTAGGVTKACPLSGSSIGADRSRTAEQLGGTTDRPGRMMGRGSTCRGMGH